MDVVGDFIPKEAHTTIFKHLVVILNLHQQLMQQLPTLNSISSLSPGAEMNIKDEHFPGLLNIVVNTFSSFLPHLKIYCDYVNNMHHANQLVVELKANNERFSQYCKVRRIPLVTNIILIHLLPLLGYGAKK
jgi:hypothetical protein